MAAPTCTTEAPTLIGKDFVTFNGVLVDTGGKACVVRFWYKRRDWPNWSTTPWQSGGTDGSPFSYDLIDPTVHGQHEHYAQVANEDGQDDGLILRYWYRWKITAYDGSPFLVWNVTKTGPFGQWAIVLQTDIPCHLTLWVDNNVPYRKTGEHFKRGVVYMHTPMTFFTPNWQLAQDESGDSITHTFLWTCQKPYGKYTFQATGTVDGRPSPSKSPFYYIACKPAPPPVATSDRCTDPAANTGYYQWWNAGSQTFTPDHDYNLHSISLRLNQFELTRKGMLCFRVVRAGGNCWAETVLYQHYSMSTSLPPPGSKDWTTWPVAGIPLTAGVVYRIVVFTYPPWYYWDGSKWVQWDGGAALRAWVQHLYECYPRGTRWYNCNIRDSSGAWRDSGYDMNFICYEAPTE